MTHNKYDDHTQMMSDVRECRVRCGGWCLVSCAVFCIWCLVNKGIAESLRGKG